MNRILKSLTVLTASALLGFGAEAQDFLGPNETYHLSSDGTSLVISGFRDVGRKDEIVFANAFLWTVENVCPKHREGISDIVYRERFSFDVTLEHMMPDRKPRKFSATVTLRFKDGKMSYLVSNIACQGSATLSKMSPIEKFNQKDTPANRQIIIGFETVCSKMLADLFHYVDTNSPMYITHWDDIIASRPVKGMNTDECLLAFGKPVNISGTDEVQWMYTSSFFLFFKDGKLTTILM